jgi:hypothetical protein
VLPLGDSIIGNCGFLYRFVSHVCVLIKDFVFRNLIVYVDGRFVF